MAPIKNSKPKTELITLVAEPRSAQSIADLEKHFLKEIKKIELDDIIAIDDLSLEKIMQMIQGMKANRFVLKYVDDLTTKYMVLDFEIKISEFIAIRKNKLLGTGTYPECAALLLQQMRKEFPDKLKDAVPEMLDEHFIKNFSQVHFNNSRLYRIVCCT